MYRVNAAFAARGRRGQKRRPRPTRAIDARAATRCLYPDLTEKIDRFRPRYGEQYQLPFDYEPEEGDGKGMLPKRPPH